MVKIPHLKPDMYRSGHSRSYLTAGAPPVLVQSQISKDGSFHMEWNTGTRSGNQKNFHCLSANGKLDPNLPENQRWIGMRVRCSCPSFDYHVIATKESGGKTLFVCKHLKTALDSVCDNDNSNNNSSNNNNHNDNESIQTNHQNIHYSSTIDTLQTPQLPFYCNGIPLLENGIPLLENALGGLEEEEETEEDNSYYYESSYYVDEEDQRDDDEDDDDDREIERLEYGLSNLSDKEIVALLFQRMKTDEGVRALSKLFPSSVLPLPPNWHRDHNNHTTNHQKNHEKFKKLMMRKDSSVASVNHPTCTIADGVVPNLPYATAELPSTFFLQALGMKAKNQRKQSGKFKF